VRVDRCFSFVDLCGFTAFADQHGDERVVLVLAKMRTALREASARRGVRIVKWLGDGAMLSSTMMDAVAGLVVELDLQMREVIPSLPIRAGLASGPVIMFEGDDYIGYPVNVAARLCAQAQPHELLATVEVASNRPRWIHAEPTRSVAVKGLAHDVEARDLSLGAPGDDPIVDPICGLAIPRHLSVGSSEARFCSEACYGSWVDNERARPRSASRTGDPLSVE
jgi:class 3 adenylate cyclase